MKAMILERIATLAENPNPLRRAEVPRPVPAEKEVLIRIACCGVCHTELDEIEGRTPPSQLPAILGHEVVGHIAELGPHATKHSCGDRVGVGWIHHSSGSEDENLAPEFRATGRDVPGGYAEFMVVPENYVYLLPQVWSAVEAAPLMCAGAVGYRSSTLESS